MSENECQLDKPPFYQCCCQCKLLVPAYDFDMKARGYACLAFLVQEHEDRAVVIDTELHSCGCEMFTDKRKDK